MHPARGVTLAMTTDALQYPGTPAHQAVLRAVASYYATDPRVLAVTVYGSLARGNWDAYSDADLAIVVADGVSVTTEWVAAEAERLCAACDFRPAIVRPSSDEADLILPLAVPMHVGIQYRPLARTSPFVGENCRILAGPLGRDSIRAAGDANRATAPALQPRSLPQLLSTCLLNTTGVDLRLHRGQYWRAYEALFSAVQNLVQVFTFSRGGTRPLPVFETQADAALKARLGAALPTYNLRELQRAYVTLLDILETDLEQISAGQVQLTPAQRELIALLRSRQHALDLSGALALAGPPMDR
jgi:hypothetical protein